MIPDKQCDWKQGSRNLYLRVGILTAILRKLEL
jgi:hypothetical protein